MYIDQIHLLLLLILGLFYFIISAFTYILTCVYIIWASFPFTLLILVKFPFLDLDEVLRMFFLIVEW
jgi:hypothetical protein